MMPPSLTSCPQPVPLPTVPSTRLANPVERGAHHVDGEGAADVQTLPQHQCTVGISVSLRHAPARLSAQHSTSPFTVSQPLLEAKCGSVSFVSCDMAMTWSGSTHTQQYDVLHPPYPTFPPEHALTTGGEPMDAAGCLMGADAASRTGGARP
jgi:hypothetical protein